ncbi:MAG: molybdopterin molybdotransferase MoeA [Gemmatimonadetes bacterium]|nr:molybdopterin molybdotransferase MoeA [Gemmatimonadota bacterium]MDA1104767.1 molybdopterin molybdotransferase MoeA [Gemmatimonadota bacterium]
MTESARASAFESRSPDWLEVDDARARVLAGAEPLEVEQVSLEDASGRALAEDIVATAQLPPWDNSAMDGYAVRADDVRGATQSSPVTLSISGVVRAGGDVAPRVESGQAVRIMTGAPIPSGADTVVRVEDTDREETAGRVQVFADRDRGRHVRDAGQDMRAGDTLFRVGDSITPGVVGVLAAAGRATVSVRRPPTVALLSTGDELRTADRYEEVEAGRGIPESNRPMLSAMLRSIGARPVDLGIARDETEDLQRRIEAGASADVLITVGGASMGEADLVKRVLDGMGFEQSFWRVRMRPGSPISFGWLTRGNHRQAVFGLPGNPSSAFVTFEVFVRPFLLRLSGHDRVLRRTIVCRATEAFNAPAALTYFQRVSIVSGPAGPRVQLTGPQVSGLVRGLARADGLAIIPPDVDGLEPDDCVEVMLLDTGPGVHDAGPM